MVKYEYLNVIYDFTKSVSDSSSEKYYIWRPGVPEPEMRTNSSLFLIANELGAEGWRLMQGETLASVLFRMTNGFNEGTQPVRRSFMFERTVS